MKELGIHVKRMGSGHVRPGATVGEALEELGCGAVGGAVAAKVDGRGVDLAFGIGPALPDDPRFGFFYDVIAPRPLTDADLPVIEARMREIAKRNLAYRREELPKPEVLRMFADRDEPLKCELIQEKGDECVSVYSIDGSAFVDFCLGPHVPGTDRLGARQ